MDVSLIASSPPNHAILTFPFLASRFSALWRAFFRTKLFLCLSPNLFPIPPYFFFFHSNRDTVLMVKNWVKYLETLWSSGCCYITSMFKLKPKHPPSCRACALKQWKREMITTTKSLHAHDRHLNQSPGAHSHRSYLIFQSTPLSTSKTTGYHWRACTSPALDLELKHLVIKLFLFAYHSPFYLLRLPS